MSLENVKEGDLLVMSRGFSENQLVKVSKKTKTQIVIGDERYSLNGWRIGDSGFHRSHVWIPREGEVGEIRRRNARASICRLIQEKLKIPEQLTDQQLIKIRDILKESAELTSSDVAVKGQCSQ